MEDNISIQHFLVLGVILFCTGLLVIIVKKNAIMVLMGIELMLNASNINLISFSQYDPAGSGQVFSLFVIVVAAAEAAVGLAIVLKVYSYFKTSNLDEVNELKG